MWTQKKVNAHDFFKRRKRLLETHALHHLNVLACRQLRRNECVKVFWRFRYRWRRIRISFYYRQENIKKAKRGGWKNNATVPIQPVKLVDRISGLCAGNNNKVIIGVVLFVELILALLSVSIWPLEMSICRSTSKPKRFLISFFKSITCQWQDIKFEQKIQKKIKNKKQKWMNYFCICVPKI